MSSPDQAKAPLLGRIETLTLVAVVGVLGLALGLAALAMPTTKSVARTVGYTQSGAFTYTASAKANSVYGAQGMTTGQPIFTKLVGAVHAGFSYRLRSHAPTSAHGTASLDALVTVQPGLSRRFVVAPSARFTGARTTVSGILPLGAITSYLKAAEKSLSPGVPGASVAATVTLRPHVDLTGAVAEHSLHSSFAPKLAFSFTGSTLTLSSDTAAEPTTTAGASLHPKKQGTIGYRAPVANTVPLAIAHPSVTTAREIGFALAGLCLLLGLWLARPLLRSRDGAGETDRIRTLYGSLLVPIDSFALPTGPVADVASIEALADLAKRYESRVLHLRGDGREGDCYLVWDNGMLYRYRSAAAPSDHTDEDLLLTRLIFEDADRPLADMVATSRHATTNGAARNGSVRPAPHRR